MVIKEERNNSIPPPCPIHGMWGGRMTTFVAVPTENVGIVTDQQLSSLGNMPLFKGNLEPWL